jgi:energy-coupling factor transport system permease protein
MGPIFVPVVIHAIIGSEDIIDAMDLRAFGVGPRTWVNVLARKLKDRILIWIGVTILVTSLALGFLGYGAFWVPEALLHLVI